MEQVTGLMGQLWLSRGWCSDCRAAAAPSCWDDHEVLSPRAAEKRLKEQVPTAALQEAAALLADVQCRGEEALHALTLLSAPSWDITLRAGGRQLNGTVNITDPMAKALIFILANTAKLTQSGADGPAGDGPPSAAARPPAAANIVLDPPPAEAPPSREMDVHHLSCSRHGVSQQEKAAALQEAQGVLRLVQVHCTDPAWSLQLLERAAPTAERLEVVGPGEPHLRAVTAMPRLRRLRVVCRGDADPLVAAKREVDLGELPPGLAGLQWLSVSHLPRTTTHSLLRAHGATLEEVELLVGPPGRRRWPVASKDLHNLLAECGLGALRRLVLRRPGSRPRHPVARCEEQRAAVSAALPGVLVQCDYCEDVQHEHP